MFDNITKFFKKFVKNKEADSKDTAKERLHLVLMQDRANVSADFLELMKQEIIDVIKKYIDVDENSIDVKLTNKTNGDGTTGAPILYANIPIISIKDENKNKVVSKDIKNEKQQESDKKEDAKNVEKDVEENKKTTKEEEKQSKEVKEQDKKVIEDEKEMQEEAKEEKTQTNTVNKENDKKENTNNQKQPITKNQKGKSHNKKQKK